MIVCLAITSILVSAVAADPGLDSVKIQHDISAYLPVSGQVEGWQPVGPPRAFVGEGLYEFINGGAVIYYEYDFNQAVTQEYTNIDGKSIDLEIYEMANPSSAYGIYTFRKGAEGEEVDIGNEGIIADYYLHFWKGNFLVTLIASDSEEATSSGLLAAAQEVDSRMVDKGQRPSLCNLLTIEGRAPLRINYLKGSLALSNVYYFAADDIFGLKEGVAGDFGDFKLFAFKYGDKKESSHWYTTARNEMKKGQRFEKLTDYDYECSMTDEHGLVIQMKVHRNYIFVYLGTPDIEPREVFHKIEYNLR